MLKIIITFFRRIANSTKYDQKIIPNKTCIMHSHGAWSNLDMGVINNCDFKIWSKFVQINFLIIY